MQHFSSFIVNQPPNHDFTIPINPCAKIFQIRNTRSDLIQIVFCTDPTNPPRDSMSYKFRIVSIASEIPDDCRIVHIINETHMLMEYP